MQEIKKAGIKEAISIESVNERFFTNEILPQFTQQEQYLQWFENKNDNLSYIYIPKTEHIPLSLLKSLHDNNIQFHIEENIYSKIINIVSASILFIAFLCLANKRLLFCFSTFPYLLLSPLVSGILILTSILIFITATFYAIEILFASINLNSAQRNERLKENIAFFALLFLAIFLSSVDSFLFFIYLILTFTASICTLYIVNKFQHLLEKEQDAQRIHEKPILYSFYSSISQKLISAKKMIFSALFLLVAYTLPIIFFNFFFLPLNKSYGNKLPLPSPSKTIRYNDFSLDSFLAMSKNKSQEVMPCLINYICDEWNSKSRNKQSLSENENAISEDFIKDCLKNIKPNSVEKLLLSEGGFLSAFYNFKFFQIERLQLLQLLISLLSIFISLAIMFFQVVR